SKPPRKKKKKRKLRMRADGAERIQSARPSVQQEALGRTDRIKGIVILSVAVAILIGVLSMAPVWIYKRKYVECGNYTQTTMENGKATFASSDDMKIARGLAYRAHAAMSWDATQGLGAKLNRACGFLTVDKHAYYLARRAAAEA